MFYTEFKELAKRRRFLEDPVRNALNFTMFLQYIVDRLELIGTVDGHFAPFVDLCKPCDVHYDYIGIYDNLEAETKYIFKELSIDIAFPARNDNFTSEKTSEIVWAYYKEVPLDILQAVWRSYKKDYLIFNIPLPGWLAKLDIEF